MTDSAIAIDEGYLMSPSPSPSVADVDILDFSFTSFTTTTTTDGRSTFASSARTSLARSSLTLSFNDRHSQSQSHAQPQVSRPHRRSDPQWSAIKAASTLSSGGSLQLRHLKLLRHLGTGNLGRVFLCRLRENDHAGEAGLFALKVVDKDALAPKKVHHAATEADILASLDHPFLPTLYARIDVARYTCLLIDYCPGGDLHSLLRRHPRGLPIRTVRFIAAEVLIALEYLHSLGIVYRDLKPENILLRADGHVMLSDFDLCFKADVAPKLLVHRKVKTGQGCGLGLPREISEVVEFVAEPTGAVSRSCVGTHEYLAPELVTGHGHGNGVDWWALGVLVYELMYGATPFKGGTKESTLRNIASSRQVRFPPLEEKERSARDLIEKLLVKDPRRRLGCSVGAADVKRHLFFKGVNWALIRNYEPPEELRLVKPEKPARCRWWKRNGKSESFKMPK